MKKLSKLFILCSSLTLLPLVSCQNDETNTQENDPSKATFDNVIFQDKKVEYDGGLHSIAPVNLPSNTTVLYIGESSFKEVGRYTIKITLKKEGFNDRNMEATLRITYPKIKDVSVVSKQTVIYDGEDHSNDIEPIFIEKPEGVVVEKFIKFKGKTVKEVKNVGTYNFHFRISAPKHEDSDLFSTLIIDGKEMNVSLQNEHLDVAYDGLDHKDEFKFNAPLGFNYDSKIKEIKNSKGEKVSECKEIEDYTLTFELSAANYKTKTLVGTMSIFDGTHIKNRENNIQVANYRENGSEVNKLIFMSLHEDGKLYLLNNKDGEATLIYNEEVKDYKVTSNLIFIKTINDTIKYKKLDEISASWTNFVDQSANMDFILVENKHVVYTRSGQTSTDICKIEGQDGTIKVLHTAPIISNLQVFRNKVYFLERSLSNIFGTIKYFALYQGQDSVTPTVLNPDVTNVFNFKIFGENVYYYGLSVKDLLGISTFGLIKDKTPKNLIPLIGNDIEYFVSEDANGKYLFYKYSETELNDPTVIKPTKGIYKHYLDVEKEDYLLLDTSKLDLYINEITLFDDQIYFSNKSPKDCHVYNIPSFGLSTKINLVR